MPSQKIRIRLKAYDYKWTVIRIERKTGARVRRAHSGGDCSGELVGWVARKKGGFVFGAVLDHAGDMVTSGGVAAIHAGIVQFIQFTRAGGGGALPAFAGQLREHARL